MTKKCLTGTSLVGQWLRLHASTVRGRRFNPWPGNQDAACHKAWPKKKIKILFQLLKDATPHVKLQQVTAVTSKITDHNK